MTRRTKLWICAGLLVLVGVMLLRKAPVNPGVTVRFVRYYEEGPALLTLTNSGQSPVSCFGVNVFLYSELKVQLPGEVSHCEVIPQSGTQLVAYPLPSVFIKDPISYFAWLRSAEFPKTISVRCIAQPSRVRRHIQALLDKMGIMISSTNFVATVTLPPRETNVTP